MKPTPPNLSSIEQQKDQYRALKERFLRIFFLGQWGLLGNKVERLVQKNEDQFDTDTVDHIDHLIGRWMETQDSISSVGLMMEHLNKYDQGTPESLRATYRDIEKHMLACQEHLHEIDEIVPASPVDYDKVFLLIKKKRREIDEPIKSDEIESWFKRGYFYDETEAYQAIKNKRGDERADLLIFEELIKREQIKAVVEPEHKQAKSRSPHKI